MKESSILSGVKKANERDNGYGETVSEGTPNNLPFRFE